MSRNIKEIGKELMGKSLNSFHRKTGLTQLEKNNEMQDGILDGILSQVDDAYIEKTEQSNVIHLDGSGDGVVVLDSIEGNTMVNIVKSYDSSNFLYVESQKLDNQYFKLQHSANENSSSVRVKYGNHIYKPNTTYTLVVDIKENTANVRLGVSGINSVITKFSSVNFSNLLGQSMITFITKDDFSTDARGENPPTLDLYFCSWDKGGDLSKHITFRYWILEGDWTNKEIPPYFKGLQSSFEEKVNDEGKYEIEILSQNRNMIDLYNENILLEKHSNFKINNGNSCTIQSDRDGWLSIYRIPVKKGRSYTLSANLSNGVDHPIRVNDKEKTDGSRVWEINLGTLNGSGYKSKTFIATKDFVNILFYKGSTQPNCDITDIMLTPNDTKIPFENMKHNKIKLLLDEPLRAIDTIKDKLCVKDNRLVIERNCGEVIFNGSEDWRVNHKMTNNTAFWTKSIPNVSNIKIPISDKFKQLSHHLIDEQGTFTGTEGTLYLTHSSSSIEELKVWLQSNLTTMVFPLAEPYYEEVLNEYGEPIILEGYENGTIYIDSTIVPTTTVRYTPKMESFKTLKEVNDNNIMLTNDVNDNIIPYMMDVDMMIMEKEMALMSQYKIRRIGAKDMTSMQKRTQDMLTRLIKGRTLTEQECKTRVVTYLDAGKITDAQADELMLLISEVYA